MPQRNSNVTRCPAPIELQKLRYPLHTQLVPREQNFLPPLPGSATKRRHQSVSFLLNKSGMLPRAPRSQRPSGIPQGRRVTARPKIKAGSHDSLRYELSLLHHHNSVVPLAAKCERHGSRQSSVPGFLFVEETTGYCHQRHLAGGSLLHPRCDG